LEDVRGRGDATGVAERVADSLRGPFPLGEHDEVFVSASIGVALGDAGEDRHEGMPNDLLRRADVAMYEAKRKGKAHHEVFNPRMDDLALGRLRMGTDLRRAVERGEFRVHHQPEVSVETGGIVGFEALVRWEHPEQGLVSPARFIPVAEETGLIVPMGRWVLEEACRQARAWRDLRPNSPLHFMSVNLSARQFEHPDLVRDVARVLRETGLEPGCLVLEITESVVMNDARSTIGTLGELKALGVRIAIDDFGTGYSSLSYLRRFPVDYLKVDRSFVDGLGENPGDAVLVSGIIDLAHALGLKVVAEGVETQEQLELLQNIGCDLAQGYHFAKPLPDQEASALLFTNRLRW
jgi:EAL domain-containing protein (putative c-di-GMP-specific phosphodiesterase class I)